MKQRRRKSKGSDRLRVAIEDVAFGGEGVGRAEGMVVFVPFTAPGDVVQVRVVDRKKNFARGRIEEIDVPGPGRVTPPCPYFGRCGGCAYQHLSDASQSDAKQKQVRNVLERLGNLRNVAVEPIVRAPQTYGYRNRISVHAEGGRLGFQGVDATELVDIERCLIASDEVNERLGELRAHRPSRGHFSLRESGLPERGFHQVNRFMLDSLQDAVAAAMPSRGRVFVEGFCGNGFFTRRVSDRFESTIACDTDADALAAAPALPRVRFVREEFGGVLARERPDTVLVDPTREGLDAAACAALESSAATRCVYVSCNPATFARDIVRMPSWTVQLVQPLDLFPQTAHIELVACLVRG